MSWQILLLLSAPAGRYFGNINNLGLTKPRRGDIFDAQHIFSNNYPCCICCETQREFYSQEWRDDLHSYISGIMTGKGARSLAVGGWKDYVHILFGIPVTLSIADFMSVVKANSSKWINEQHFIKGKFQWQEGYGGFSYAKSQRDVVINYIINQEEHHRTRSFKEEYLKILTDFEVNYDDKYLFEFYD